MGIILVATDSSVMIGSSDTMCTLTSFIAPSVTFPFAISRCTNSMARSSRSSDELKLISLIRFWIACGLLGTSSRSSGLMFTISRSSGSLGSNNGNSAGLPV